MRRLTDYRWFMSRPLWYVAVRDKLFSIGWFLWFSFFNYFYVSLSFLHRRVFFVLKWFAWRLRMRMYWFRTSSGQQTGTENQLNWRKIWRNTENVNKFYSEQYKKWIEIIFNFGTGYYLVEVSNEVQNLKNVFKSSFSKIYYLGVRCLFGWMRRNPRFNHGYSGQILVYVLIVNCYPTWKKGQTDVKGINKEFNL